VDTEIRDETVYEYSNVEALNQYFGDYYVQMVVVWGKLYKKELLEGLRFPVGRVHEDEFLIHRVIFRAKKLAFTKAKLLYYWRRSDSIMGVGFNLKHKADEIDALMERAEFLKEHGLYELRDYTYRQLFYTYVKAFRYLGEEKREAIGEDYYGKFEKLKDRLREGSYRPRFKLFYELYYRFPVAADSLYRRYSSIKLALGYEK
jgi:hypothetical protein